MQITTKKNLKREAYDTIWTIKLINRKPIDKAMPQKGKDNQNAIRQKIKECATRTPSKTGGRSWVLRKGKHILIDITRHFAHVCTNAVIGLL